MVDVLEEETPCQWYKHDFLAEKQAGIAYSRGKTSFEKIHDEQILTGAEVLGPFKDDEEWELAKWLIKNVGHTAAEEFLKLPMVHVESPVVQMCLCLCLVPFHHLTNHLLSRLPIEPNPSIRISNSSMIKLMPFHRERVSTGNVTNLNTKATHLMRRI